MSLPPFIHAAHPPRADPAVVLNTTVNDSITHLSAGGKKA